MPNDYRGLHNLYSQGMSQPNASISDAQPAFDFLQGWSSSPHAGYLPQRQAQQVPFQQGTPEAPATPSMPMQNQGFMGGGQPGNMQPMRSNQPMRNNGVSTMWDRWRGYRDTSLGNRGVMPNDDNRTNVRDWGANYGKPPMMQPNYGMRQPYNPYGNQTQPGFSHGYNEQLGNKPGYDQYGRPIHTINPGRDPNLPPGAI